MQENVWVEKYRPRSLADIVDQSDIINNLKKSIQILEYTHFIFSGSAGTGKTTTAFSYIRDLYHRIIPSITEFPYEAILFRNASDKNKLSDNDEIKDFVSSCSLSSYLPLKFVILDECDNMSKEKQFALRRILETAPSSVRFIFICNYVENIEDPILSRCSIYHFYPLKETTIEKQLQTIALKEHCSIDPSIIHIISSCSQGDLRSAINTLQFLAMAENFTAHDLFMFLNLLSPEELQDIGFAIIDTSFQNYELILDRFPSSSTRNMLQQLLFWFLDQPLPFSVLEKISNIIADFDLRFTEGSDHILQMNSMLAELMLCFNE